MEGSRCYRDSREAGGGGDGWKRRSCVRGSGQGTPVPARKSKMMRMRKIDFPLERLGPVGATPLIPLATASALERASLRRVVRPAVCVRQKKTLGRCLMGAAPLRGLPLCLTRREEPRDRSGGRRREGQRRYPPDRGKRSHSGSP